MIVLIKQEGISMTHLSKKSGLLLTALCALMLGGCPTTVVYDGTTKSGDRYQDNDDNEKIVSFANVDGEYLHSATYELGSDGNYYCAAGCDSFAAPARLPATEFGETAKGNLEKAALSKSRAQGRAGRLPPAPRVMARPTPTISGGHY